MIRNLFIRVLLMFVFLWMFAACDSQTPQIDYHPLYLETLNDAINRQDPSLCLGLPTSARFVYDEYPYNVSYKDFQNLCLQEYSKKMK